MKRWPLHKTHFWERIPFFRLLIPLVAGVGFYPANEAHDQSFLYPLLICATVSIALYIVTAIQKKSTDLIKAAQFISIHASLFLLTWVLCYYHDVRNYERWFGNSIDTSEYSIVQITNKPEEKEKTWKLEVSVTGSITNTKISPAIGEALVYVYKYDAPVLREGDVFIIPNKWQPIENRGNPFEFNYAAYCARDNIYYTAFVGGKELMLSQAVKPDNLPWVKRVHNWCTKQLAWYIKDRATLGLLQAMLAGDKDMLDEELTDAYAATGIIHIMAISGAHITIFFLLVAFLLSWLKHKKYHRVKYIAAIPFIWLYVLVAGAPASAVRAATMFSLLAIGFALQKHPNGINQLLATAFVLLCVNPMWLYAIGFQLSFTAVLSIFIFYRHVYRLYTPVNKITRALWSAIAVSIAAEILIAPLVVYYFHLFPLQFIIANVLAYLFMGVILIAGMLLIALSPFYTIAHALGIAITWLVIVFNQLIFRLQYLNPERFSRLTLSTEQLVVLYLTIAGLAVWLINKKKPGLYISASAFCAFLFLCTIHQWQLLHQQMLIVYNANGGSYIELIQGKTAVLIDTPKRADAKTEKYVIRPAHINLHIQSVDSSHIGKNMIELNGKKIFILNEPVSDTLIPADYVVLNYNAGTQDLATIKQVVEPEVLVVGTKLSRNKAKQIGEAAKQLQLPIHSIYDDGAFILVVD